MNVNRRSFLQSLVMATLSTQARGFDFFSKVKLPLIIFLELKGGNDFLSTLSPYSEQEYVKLRPTLHLTKTELNVINSELGFHKEISTLFDLFQSKELAVIQGLGYQNPSFSHFRSLDIWETGSNGDEFLHDGWAGRALKEVESDDRFIDAVSIGALGAGPVRGLDKRAFILDNPERFLNSYKLQKITEEKNPSKSLNHILAIQKNINETFFKIKELPGMNKINYSGSAFHVNVRIVKAILSGIPTLPYLKLTQEGYDTHSSQQLSTGHLMQELNLGLNDLIGFLKASGRWNDTVIVTYSEFGRSARENFSRGTDHGTSSCQFVMGGRVKGGLYGTYPSFKEIENFHFVPTMDYRSMFSTLISDFWKIDSAKVFAKKFERLQFIRS